MHISIELKLLCLESAADLVPVHVLDYRPRRLARWLWRRAAGRPIADRIALKTAAVRLDSLQKGIER